MKMKVAYNKKLELKLSSLWRRNVAFAKAVAVLLERKGKTSGNMTYDWNKVYEEEKGKTQYSGSPNIDHTETRPVICFGDYVEYVAKLKTQSGEIKRNTLDEKINEGKIQKQKSLNSLPILTSLQPTAPQDHRSSGGTQQPLGSFGDFKKDTSMIQSSLLRVIRIKGDGNCLYRSLSYALFGIEERHAMIRKEVVNFVTDNWKKYAVQLNVSYSVNIKMQFETKEQYSNYMGNNGIFGTDFEVSMFSVLYEIRVVIYTIENNSYKIRGICGPEYNSNQFIMLLFTEEEINGHFEVLKHIDNQEEEGKVIEITNKKESTNEIYTKETKHEYKILINRNTRRKNNKLKFPNEREERKQISKKNKKYKRIQKKEISHKQKKSEVGKVERSLRNEVQEEIVRKHKTIVENNLKKKTDETKEKKEVESKDKKNDESNSEKRKEKESKRDNKHDFSIYEFHNENRNLEIYENWKLNMIYDLESIDKSDYHRKAQKENNTEERKREEMIWKRVKKTSGHSFLDSNSIVTRANDDEEGNENESEDETQEVNEMEMLERDEENQTGMLDNEEKIDAQKKKLQSVETETENTEDGNAENINESEKKKKFENVQTKNKYSVHILDQPIIISAWKCPETNCFD